MRLVNFALPISKSLNNALKIQPNKKFTFSDILKDELKEKIDLLNKSSSLQLLYFFKLQYIRQINNKTQKENHNSNHNTDILFQKLKVSLKKNKTIKSYINFNNLSHLDKISANAKENSFKKKQTYVNVATLKNFSETRSVEKLKNLIKTNKVEKPEDFGKYHKKFSLKIPLDENTKLQISYVRNNFYAKIISNSETASLLIQNLSHLTQQVANLGFNKTIIQVQAAQSSGGKNNSKHGSQDSNNKHKNEAKYTFPHKNSKSDGFSFSFYL